MLDTITIKNLTIHAYHGVYAEEKKLGQKIYVDAELKLDLHKAGLADDLSQTVNYADIAEYIYGYLKTRSFDLLEAAAEQLCQELLIKFKLIREIVMEIRKPSAPIPYALDYVAVKITRKWHRAYIGIGSNMGNRKANIKDALERIKKTPYMNLLNTSKLIESKPYGNTNQDNFINGCIEVDTIYTPCELLNHLLTLEKNMGRKRTTHWGPRIIDLDIIFYDDVIINDHDLIIPHPDMHNRDFVLYPLNEIAPYIMHPIFHETVYDLAENLRALS